MITKKELLDSHQAYLEYQVSEEVWDKAWNEILVEENNITKIAGFRAGKAPLNMVLNHLGEEKVFDLTSEKVLRNNYKKIVEEAEMKILRTSVLNVEKQPNGLPLYKFTFDLLPEITLKSKLDKMKIDIKKLPDVEDELKETVLSMQDSLAKLTKIGGTPLSRGQVGLFSTQNVGDDKNRRIRLNMGKEEYFPGFDDQVEGMKPGEEKEVYFSSGDKEFQITVKLEGNYSKELPLIDDEFAQRLGYTDLNTLSSTLREKVSLQVSKQRKELITNQALNLLLKKAEILLPQGLIEDEKDDILSVFVEDLEKRGLTLEAYLETEKKSMEVLRKEAEATAKRRLEFRMILDKLASDYEVSVSEEDLNTELEKLSKEEKIPLTKFKSKLKPEEFNRINNYIKREKLLDMIPELVKVKEA
ncbi:MAG: Trigger factor [candidate division WS2 bacterium]|uniref:Trigger factor n=1 Tax=Psychracetigena formicireducens TaxID=2986056 RepID=A0A9E2BHD6_PSYF1|nr:Trigger factor [Candidatus Psychracetigena formicireducens]